MSASKMGVLQLESGVYVYVCAMETIKGEILQKKVYQGVIQLPSNFNKRKCARIAEPTVGK